MTNLNLKTNGNVQPPKTNRPQFETKKKKLLIRKPYKSAKTRSNTHFVSNEKKIKQETEVSQIIEKKEAQNLIREDKEKTLMRRKTQPVFANYLISNLLKNKCVNEKIQEQECEREQEQEREQKEMEEQENEEQEFENTSIYEKKEFTNSVIDYLEVHFYLAEQIENFLSLFDDLTQCLDNQDQEKLSSLMKNFLFLSKKIEKLGSRADEYIIVYSQKISKTEYNDFLLEPFTTGVTQVILNLLTLSSGYIKGIDHFRKKIDLEKESLEIKLLDIAIKISCWIEVVEYVEQKNSQKRKEVEPQNNQNQNQKNNNNNNNNNNNFQSNKNQNNNDLKIENESNTLEIRKLEIKELRKRRTTLSTHRSLNQVDKIRKKQINNFYSENNKNNLIKNNNNNNSSSSSSSSSSNKDGNGSENENKNNLNVKKEDRDTVKVHFDKDYFKTFIISKNCTVQELIEKIKVKTFLNFTQDYVFVEKIGNLERILNPKLKPSFLQEFWEQSEKDFCKFEFKARNKIKNLYNTDEKRLIKIYFENNCYVTIQITKNTLCLDVLKKVCKKIHITDQSIIGYSIYIKKDTFICSYSTLGRFRQVNTSINQKGLFQDSNENFHDLRFIELDENIFQNIEYAEINSKKIILIFAENSLHSPKLPTVQYNNTAISIRKMRQIEKDIGEEKLEKQKNVDQTIDKENSFGVNIITEKEKGGGREGGNVRGRGRGKGRETVGGRGRGRGRGRDRGRGRGKDTTTTNNNNNNDNKPKLLLRRNTFNKKNPLINHNNSTKNIGSHNSTDINTHTNDNNINSKNNSNNNYNSGNNNNSNKNKYSNNTNTNNNNNNNKENQNIKNNNEKKKLEEKILKRGEICKIEIFKNQQWKQFFFSTKGNRCYYFLDLETSQANYETISLLHAKIEKENTYQGKKNVIILNLFTGIKYYLHFITNKDYFEWKQKIERGLINLVDNNLKPSVIKNVRINKFKLMEITKIKQKMQSRTFTNWLNHHISTNIKYLEVRKKVIEINKDLDDGLILLLALEKITNQEYQYNLSPIRLLHKVNNLQIFFKALKSGNLDLGEINEESVLDGNLNFILSLVWLLIYKMENMNSSRDNLLFWLREKIKKVTNREIENFTDFKDGNLFHYLLLSIKPDIYTNFDDILKKSQEEKLYLAFRDSLKYFKIPKILEINDFEKEYIDERSIMTYLFYFQKITR
ncbi:hypothetical protein M0812_29250 [Anaeramoeba flamelloides]|uniref:Uncharacterized protein n=1 Tax=Anaeramoeba flamelloides TaxID=1746091 RepID=A0AAV7Y3U2_9EUKA|nr:hypothetical protein M0812_29250 [Anaeramoeba flamelloides]